MRLSRIAILRDRNGWSQEYFAELMDCSQSTITSWETGKRNPSLETICKIAEIFNVSVDYLLDLTDLPTKSPAPADQEPDSGPMPENIAELRQLIRSIVDQVLASSRQSSGDRAEPADQPARRDLDI